METKGSFIHLKNKMERPCVCNLLCSGGFCAHVPVSGELLFRVMSLETWVMQTFMHELMRSEKKPDRFTIAALANETLIT